MQVDQEAHSVPFDLEAPVPILFWDPVEFSVSISLLGFGIISKLWVLGLIASAVVLIGSRYLKRGAKEGAMQHWLWAKGLNLDGILTSRFKPAYLNDYIE